MLNSIMYIVLSAAITATQCENLTNLELADTEIISAELIPEGPPLDSPLQVDIPSHCRVQLDLMPSADSLIKMEL